MGQSFQQGTIIPQSILLYLVIFAVAEAGLSLDVLNQCPQPTEANPDPPALLFAHPNDCRYYFSCVHGRPKLMWCKPFTRTRFSEYFHTCVGFNTEYDTCTRSNAQRECTNGFTGLIAHPTFCHRYHNCSKDPTSSGGTSLREYVEECPYPQLFDITEGKCKPSKEVNCGSQRIAAKNPCDYVSSSCTGPNCPPCYVKLSSCAGREDGLHALPGHELSVTYIRCHAGQLAEKFTCKEHERTGAVRFFSQITKTCIPL